MIASTLFYAFLALLNTNIVAAADPLLVQTTSGKVRGYLDANTTSVPLQKWYGVRFAQDTSGANRWRPPKPFFDLSRALRVA